MKLQQPLKTGMKKAHFTGVLFGFSQFMTFVSYCILFWAAAYMIKVEADNNVPV